MPFQSKSQWRKCWAMKRRGEAGSWDCKEWADSTKKPFKKLPEAKPMSEKEAFDRMVRVKTAMYKLQALFEKASAEDSLRETSRRHTGNTFVPPATGPKPKLMQPPFAQPATQLGQVAGQQAGVLAANSYNARNFQPAARVPAVDPNFTPASQRTYPIGMGPKR